MKKFGEARRINATIEEDSVGIATCELKLSSIGASHLSKPLIARSGNDMSH